MVNFISLLQSISNVLNRRGVPSTTVSTPTTVFSTTLLTQGPTPITTSLTAIEFYSTATFTYTSPDSIVTTTFDQTSVSWPVEPLTTIFTPQQNCLSELFAESLDSDSALGSYPTFHLPQTEQIDCFPKDYFVVTYYSPGICPSGYTIDYQDVIEKTTVSGSLVPESRGICCPM